MDRKIERQRAADKMICDAPIEIQLLAAAVKVIASRPYHELRDCAVDYVWWAVDALEKAEGVAA